MTTEGTDLPHHRLENRGLKTRGLHRGKRPGAAQEGQDHHHDQTLMPFRPRTLALQKQQRGKGEQSRRQAVHTAKDYRKRVPRR